MPPWRRLRLPNQLQPARHRAAGGHPARLYSIAILVRQSLRCIANWLRVSLKQSMVSFNTDMIKYKKVGR